MPIYEYRCDACGHELEALQKVSDKPLRRCPDCGKPKLRRLLSAPMFLLKGSGWYETDFKSDKETKRNLADRPEKEAAVSASDAKAETKPESTTEAKKETKAETKAEPEKKGPSVSVSKPAKARVPSRTGLRKARRRRA